MRLDLTTTKNNFSFQVAFVPFKIHAYTSRFVTLMHGLVRQVSELFCSKKNHDPSTPPFIRYRFFDIDSVVGSVVFPVVRNSVPWGPSLNKGAEGYLKAQRELSAAIERLQAREADLVREHQGRGLPLGPGGAGG